MKNKLLDSTMLDDETIENRIYEIRSQQVMLDSDIAELFDVETKVLNQQMKRNIDRFPNDFCFRLRKDEYSHILRSQFVTSNNVSSKRRYNPYVFTEHGIIALAGVIKSDVAAKMSIEIVRKFVQMRKFILENGDSLLALAKLQNRQIEFENETNQRFDKVFEEINKSVVPKETIFYAGRYYDSFDFLSSLIAKAKESIIIVDPYADDKIFKYLKVKDKKIVTMLCISSKSKISKEVRRLFESEYGPVHIKVFNDIYDRYLFVDEDCYLLGTSLNYMGKGMFSIIKFEDKQAIKMIIDKIKN